MTLAPIALLGRMTLAFLTLIGSVSMFAAQAIVQGIRPPYYRQQIVRQMLEIGYYSLPVVGLTAIFTGANRDAAMRTLYEDHWFPVWRSGGADDGSTEPLIRELFAFSDTGPYSKHGSWGLSEDPKEPSASPKVAAISTLNQENQRWWSGN